MARVTVTRLMPSILLRFSWVMSAISTPSRRASLKNSLARCSLLAKPMFDMKRVEFSCWVSAWLRRAFANETLLERKSLASLTPHHTG